MKINVTPPFTFGSINLRVFRLHIMLLICMPGKILGMSRIISNGRVSELLCQKKLGKKSVKNRDYLQYLLINNGYVIVEV
jgi:hypothetical protein